MSLTISSEPVVTLGVANASARDEGVSMDVPTHVYTVKDVPYEISGTGLKGAYLEKFRKDSIMETTMFKGVWGRNLDENAVYPGRNPEYLGMTRLEIRDLWTQKADLGTEMHDAIERYLDRSHNPHYTRPRGERMGILCTNKDGVEGGLNHLKDVFNQFLDFEDRFTGKERWEIFRTEWMIFSEAHSCAGSIDALYRRLIPGTDTYEYMIVDWKRTPKDLQRKNGNGLYPIEFVPGTDKNAYFIQVCLYAEFLRDYYDIDVTRCAIVQFKPGSTEYEFYSDVDGTHDSGVDTPRAVNIMLKNYVHNRVFRKRIREWEQSEDKESDGSTDNPLPTQKRPRWRACRKRKSRV